MLDRICKYFLFLLVITAVFSCSKGASGKSDTYIVSASKMIGLTSNNWDNDEQQLSDKMGYQYIKSPDNQSSIIKAVVSLPAIDDSNRTVNGAILLNVHLTTK